MITLKIILIGQSNQLPSMSGEWERVKPRLTKYGSINANPGQDSNDFGNIAYVTGNGNPGAACDNVATVCKNLYLHQWICQALICLN